MEAFPGFQLQFLLGDSSEQVAHNLDQMIFFLTTLRNGDTVTLDQMHEAAEAEMNAK
jgi:hypothetical protein